MDWNRLTSRKLWVSVFAIAVVAVAELMGAPLSPEALDAIQTVVMSLVGAQGLVDTASAWKAGKAIADVAQTISDEPTEP